MTMQPVCPPSLANKRYRVDVGLGRGRPMPRGPDVTSRADLWLGRPTRRDGDSPPSRSAGGPGCALLDRGKLSHEFREFPKIPEFFHRPHLTHYTVVASIPGMTKLATDTQVLSVRLPGDLYRAVQQVARREERPMSWLVRKVLEGWLRDDREDGMQP